MNFTYVFGFVVLRDVVKVFPVSSSSFARKTTGRNRARSHSGAWRGLQTKWDLKLSLPSPTYLIRYLFVWDGTTTSKLSLDTFQLWQLRSLNFRWFSYLFGSKWDPLTSAWRQPRETCWTSDGRFSSPETNLKVGLLPLFFMQLLLSHIFLSFMVRTSPLSLYSKSFRKYLKNKIEKKKTFYVIVELPCA